jgi:hypothetical protein
MEELSSSALQYCSCELIECIYAELEFFPFFVAAVQDEEYRPVRETECFWVYARKENLLISFHYFKGGIPGSQNLK